MGSRIRREATKSRTNKKIIMLGMAVFAPEARCLGRVAVTALLPQRQMWLDGISHIGRVHDEYSR